VRSTPTMAAEVAIRFSFHCRHSARGPSQWLTSVVPGACPSARLAVLTATALMPC
jgi:hypothetical protein